MPKHTSTSRQCVLAGSFLLLATAWLARLPGTRAHDLFTAYIQHRVAVTLGAKHVDVTLQLTFFEDGSEHERAHMDINGDGRVSRAEMEAYLKDLEPQLTDAVKLRLADKAVNLTPLRAPELDLLGNDRVGRGHHRLTLHFFAPPPAQLLPGAQLVVEDRLWPGVRALGMIQVEGRDGCRLEAIPPGDPVWPPAWKGEAREFKARLLVPPQAPPVQKTPAHTRKP